MVKRFRLLHAAALSSLALIVACGSTESGTTGGPGEGPCKGLGAAQLDPIECHLGVCNVLVAACEGGVPASCPPSQPQDLELCNDDLDNDCNGLIDEGCSCADGATKPCYSGSAETRNTGSCRDGVQACPNGTWGECKGDVRPAKEVCGDGFDNDCNGKIDDSCKCTDGAQQSCYAASEATAGVGPCKLGAQACAGGAWGDCVGAVLPQAEACDAIDNDCNGQVDDGDFGAGAACDVPGAMGACKAGLTACGPSGLQCKPSVAPVVETCDGVDNDCDGVIDNGDFCCADGKKSGPESDVDCGADCDVKCDSGQACHTPGDCKSGVCTNAICSP